jgi:hypothetical protein
VPLPAMNRALTRSGPRPPLSRTDSQAFDRHR